MRNFFICAMMLAASGCSTKYFAPDAYTFDLPNYASVGSSTQCPIVGPAQTVRATQNQSFWVLSSSCPAKKPKLPSETRFSITSSYHLPDNSKLVGFIFAKRRLTDSSMLISSVRPSALRLGGDIGIPVISDEAEGDGVVILKIFRTPNAGNG